MSSAYGRTGVRTTEEMSDFPRLLDVLRKTFAHRPEGTLGNPLLDFGYYANVLDLGNGTGLAISTDGVGTKILIAQALAKYDTIGVDCVAMNVNDVICVGAEPVAMTDYIATQATDGRFLSELGVGLAEGARQANITIPGGEIAQVRELVQGFDIVGTCVGLVETHRIIDGAQVKPGDAVIGFASSGIHSNGLTLARDVLVGGDPKQLFKHVEEFGRTLGEELLEPTRIYAALAMRLLSSVDVRALAHITSDGFLNLARVAANVGFVIDNLPEVPAVFQRIAGVGSVSLQDMYLTYNMGVGFCAVVPQRDVEPTLKTAGDLGIQAWQIGVCTDDRDKRVVLPAVGLRSHEGHFERC